MVRNRVLSSLVVVILLSTLFSHLVGAESQQDPPLEDDGIEQKVLIIGIDGMRGDVAEMAAQRNDSAFGRIKEEGRGRSMRALDPTPCQDPAGLAC